MRLRIVRRFGPTTRHIWPAAGEGRVGVVVEREGCPRLLRVGVVVQREGRPRMLRVGRAGAGRWPGGEAGDGRIGVAGEREGGPLVLMVAGAGAGRGPGGAGSRESGSQARSCRWPGKMSGRMVRRAALAKA
ncbi:MAG: hypothetical protein ACI8QC_003607 [Planctomycetota bacterium]|jgi:hypothetical protein